MNTELARYDAACRALAECRSVDEVKDIHDKAVAVKAYAKQANNTELKADAERIIWRAKDRGGVLLREMAEAGERHDGHGRKERSQNGTVKLDDLGVDKKFSSEAQRTAAMPVADKEAALASATPDMSMKHALKKLSRERRHKDIAQAANLVAVEDRKFSLIYADPPWAFETYSEKGKDLAPDQHYSTMSLDEIKGFKYGTRYIADIAAKDALLFLWCTPANLLLALDVMRAWGFTYKTHAVWVKDKFGMGFYFRQAHEPILVGTKGAPPMPESVYPSSFVLPRGAHSAKPTEIRQALQAMYPHWGEANRLELFPREPAPGWTVYGYEADR